MWNLEDGTNKNIYKTDSDIENKSMVIKGERQTVLEKGAGRDKVGVGD